MAPAQLWRYKLDSTDGRDFEWGEVVLCSSGFFGAVSDYGNYSFAWRNFGSGGSFRAFIVGIGPDYAHSKLAEPVHSYDGQATHRKVRKAVGEMIKAREITAARGKDILDEIKDDHSSLDRSCDWQEWAWHSEGAMLLGERVYHDDLYTERPEPQCWAFCTRILPRLQAAIRAELEAEERIAEARALLTEAAADG
jgi:hypothetical protein